MPIIDITGHRYGRLLVLSFVKCEQRHSYFLCKCDCGNKIVTRSNSLRTNNTQSCGCLDREKQKEFQLQNTTHGLSNSRVYHAWEEMKRRCLNPKAINYKNYGGRGIQICKRWHKFENFFADMGHPPTPKHEIDRIKNDGNYKKSNCRWSTHTEQQHNRRNNHRIEYNGKTKTLTQWAAYFNISAKLLSNRIVRGWPIERAFTEPVHKSPSKTVNLTL